MNMNIKLTEEQMEFRHKLFYLSGIAVGIGMTATRSLTQEVMSTADYNVRGVTPINFIITKEKLLVIEDGKSYTFLARKRDNGEDYWMYVFC